MIESLNRMQMEWESRQGNCKDCPLWRPDRGIEPKFGYGSLSSRIAVVGLSPNEKLDPKTEFRHSDYQMPDHDVETHWYWAAAAWDEWPIYKVMKALLSDTKWKPWDLFFTNLCACSWSEIEDEDRILGIQCCARNLEVQMHRLSPSFAVTFGKEAAEVMTGQKLRSFAKNHGSILEGRLVPEVLVFLHWGRGYGNMIHTDFATEDYYCNISRILKETLRNSRD